MEKKGDGRLNSFWVCCCGNRGYRREHKNGYGRGNWGKEGDEEATGSPTRYATHTQPFFSCDLSFHSVIGRGSSFSLIDWSRTCCCWALRMVWGREGCCVGRELGCLETSTLPSFHFTHSADFLD